MSNSYVCNRNVTQSICTRVNLKNCSFHNETIEDQYINVQTYIDGESTYLDIFTNQKVYKLDPWSFPVGENGHLIIQLSPATIISEKNVLFPHVIFPEVINLLNLYILYVLGVN